MNVNAITPTTVLTTPSSDLPLPPLDFQPSVNVIPVNSVIPQPQPEIVPTDTSSDQGTTQQQQQQITPDDYQPIVLLNHDQVNPISNLSSKIRNVPSNCLKISNFSLPFNQPFQFLCHTIP